MKVTFRTALKGLQVAALGLFGAAVLAQPAVKRPAFRGGCKHADQPLWPRSH